MTFTKISVEPIEHGSMNPNRPKAIGRTTRSRSGLPVTPAPRQRTLLDQLDRLRDAFVFLGRRGDQNGFTAQPRKVDNFLALGDRRPERNIEAELFGLVCRFALQLESSRAASD